MTTVQGPTAGRRRLRTALRAAREKAELTQEHVAEAMDWSLSKLIRIETGRVSVSTNDVRALLHLYRIDGTAEAERAHRARPAGPPEAVVAGLPLRRSPRTTRNTSASRPRRRHALLPVQRRARPAQTRGLRARRDHRPHARPDPPRRGRRPGRRPACAASTRSSAATSPPRFDIILDEAVLRRVIGGAVGPPRAARAPGLAGHRPNDHDPGGPVLGRRDHRRPAPSSS